MLLSGAPHAAATEMRVAHERKLVLRAFEQWHEAHAIACLRGVVETPFGTFKLSRGLNCVAYGLYAILTVYYAYSNIYISY